MYTGTLISFLTVTATGLLSVASAVDETTNPFVPAGISDVRSPCPALNSLANHGLLPHDGKSIDLEILAAGTRAGFNLARDAAILVGTQALASSRTGNASTFDLDDLNTHQIIEHDGSLSRGDIFFGDNHSFNPAAWARTLANWGDVETLTFAIAGAERTARFNYGASTNPDFNATFAQSGSLLEYSLLLSSFGDPVLGNANKSLAMYMFENERLPFSLGWSAPTTPISVSSARNMSAAIAAFL
ncbi:chloroperoxidase-like protein [Phlyctema vagabunda]|uniref:Chloroperoxidase-like protein n=1 Tax=Phlyctema vagabunda TaxID=108571 RepID=A0ABR4P4X6_9HELO